MEKIFRALSDPSRRRLLDVLRRKDGRTVGQLDAALPHVTRFATMKHLRVLEAAGLVVTRKVGREKLHYLNPVPIRLIHDRWISKYAEPVVGAMSKIKSALEEKTMSAPRHVYEVLIRTTPETRSSTERVSAAAVHNPARTAMIAAAIRRNPPITSALPP